MSGNKTTFDENNRPTVGSINFGPPSNFSQLTTASESNMPPVKPPKNSPITDPEKLEWAIGKIKSCQDQGLYGKLTIHFENGRIVRATSEKSEVPK